MRNAAKRDGILLGGVVCVIWVMLLFLSAQSTFWERDESRYATAALEMKTSGNFLYPTFNHELRAFQPIMVYWLMTASQHALGSTETGVRFPSTVGIALVCLLTGLIARAFFPGGAIAAALAGSSPLLLMAGSAATTDATLLLFILLAEAVFVHAWLTGPRWWQVPAMGLAMGGAMLTKGPVGLVVPVLSVVTALALARGRSAAGPFGVKLALASVIALGIFLAWGIPANAATGGEYWRIAIAERLPARLFTAMENHGGQGLVPFLLHLPYYPAVLLLGFLPWSVYLVLAPGSLRHGSPGGGSWARSGDGLRSLLIGMTVPTLVLMTLIVSKLPHYVLPVVPWLALLTARAIHATDSPGFEETARCRMRVALWGAGIPCVLLAVAAAAVPMVWAPAAAFRASGILLGGFAVVLLVVVGRCLLRGEIRRAVAVHFAGLLGFLVLCAFFLLPVLENHLKPAQLLAKEIRPHIPENARAAMLGWREPGPHFYMGGRKIAYLSDGAALETWAAGPGPLVLIMRTGECPVPDGFRKLAVRTGIDHVGGKGLSLEAFLRE